MEIKVEQVTKKDITELEKVFSETVLKEFPEFSEKTRIHLIRPLYKKHMMLKKIRLGAYCDGKMVGYLLGDYPFGGILYVSWIAVLKEYQGKGVGRKLLLKLEQIAKKIGAHGITLETYERDLGFYKKLGFEITGKDDKGYFGLQEYHMKKLIQEPKEENFLKY